MAEGLYDWYSPDGSKVLTFTPGNYGWASMIWKFFDQDAVTAFHKLHHRTQLWSDYFKKHQIPPHYAILMSCDATKPVDYQPVIDEWNKIADASDIPLPHLKASTAEAYFEAVRGENTQFEKIAGERPDLWLYIHGPAHYEATKYKREAAVCYRLPNRLPHSLLVCGMNCRHILVVHSIGHGWLLSILIMD